MKVLDDGFVEYLDHMGDDLAVVKAARQSYQGHKATAREEFSDKDKALVRYLMRHKHMTPFEMCILKIGIRIPMDAWRQFVRHRLFSINEYSTRYKPAINSRQVADRWRSQSTDNKQGSGGFITGSEAIALSCMEKSLHEKSMDVYEHRLRAGVAREQARKDLPLCTYTEAIVECDLRGWLHFLGLRLHSHAQYEIRQYAEAISSIVATHWPHTWQAFEDYELNALTLSACDLAAMRNMTYQFPTQREEQEYLEKCLRIGLA